MYAITEGDRKSESGQFANRSWESLRGAQPFRVRRQPRQPGFLPHHLLQTTPGEIQTFCQDRLIVPTNEIIAENFAPSRWLSSPRTSIKVVDWNIDRGLELPSIIDFLGDANADILLLQEVDVNARRTHRKNVAQEIARKLRLNYVFGREFVELTQGSKASPAYHGQATLSPWKICSPRIIRFKRQSGFWKPRWYVPNMEVFQERLGGRIALVCGIRSSDRASILSYNLHLESRGNDEMRLAQLDEVLADARGFEAARLTVIAGDFNLDASKPSSANAIAREGFIRAAPADRLATTPGHHLFEPGRHIDWAFVRGPAQPSKARVHTSVKASDHFPISVELAVSSGF